MRKVTKSLSAVIEEIKQMQGKNVNLEVNRGRKKIEKYEAVIQKVYPSVFMVSITKPDNKGNQSYSYSDVLCGDVVIKNEQKLS